MVSWTESLNNWHKRFPGVILVAAFFMPLAVYLPTLAPSLYVEDSAELATAAVTLGIPHPPGYPTYVLLGKLFSLLPIGQLAWRVNLFSAVAGAAAVALLYLIARRLTKQTLIALAAALTFAVSSTFWQQAVAAEVYTLYAAFALAAVYLVLRWRDDRRSTILVVLGLVVGVGSGAHQLMLLLALAIIVALLLDGWRPSSWREIVYPISSFLLGLAVYIYLPLRSLANPALDWGNPETLANLWAHFSRAQYADASLFANLSGKLSLIVNFFSSLPSEVGWIACALAITGFIYSWRARLAGPLLCGILVSQVVLVILLRQYGWGVGVAYNYRAYFVVAHAIVVLYAAIGALWAWQKLVSRGSSWPYFRRVYTNIGGLAFAVLIPVLLMVRNLPMADLHNHNFTESFGRALLASLPAKAILVSKADDLAGDTELFALAYLKYVAQLRPDVSVIDDFGVFSPPASFVGPGRNYYGLTFLDQRRELVLTAWDYAQNQGRPLATTFPLEGYEGLNLVSRATGASYLVFASSDEAQKQVVRPGTAVAVPNVVPPTRYGEQDSVAHYLYLRAAYFEEQGMRQAAQRDIIQAIKYDNEISSTAYQDFVAHRVWWLGDR